MLIRTSSRRPGSCSKGSNRFDRKTRERPTFEPSGTPQFGHIRFVTQLGKQSQSAIGLHQIETRPPCGSAPACTGHLHIHIHYTHTRQKLKNFHSVTSAPPPVNSSPKLRDVFTIPPPWRARAETISKIPLVSEKGTRCGIP